MNKFETSSYVTIKSALVNRNLKQALYDKGKVIMDGVLLTLHGEEHRKRRKLEHRVFQRDLDGGLVSNEKTDPSNHQYGIVTLLVQKILSEGGYPDDKNKPEADLSTERFNWAYPIIFGDKK